MVHSGTGLVAEVGLGMMQSRPDRDQMQDDTKVKHVMGGGGGGGLPCMWM